MLFQKLGPDHVAELRDRYSGSQKERATRDAAAAAVSADKPAGKPAEKPAAEPKKPAEPKPVPYADLPVEERFARLVDLRVARIVKIERHPKADKLYLETLDDGSGEERVIVSGLVPFYAEEELLGKHIVLANNLKPAKLRRITSYNVCYTKLLRAVRRLRGGGLRPGILGGVDPERRRLVDRLGRRQLRRQSPVPVSYNFV